MQILSLFLVAIVAVVDGISIQNHVVKRIPTLALPDVFGPVTSEMFERAQARRSKASKAAHTLPGLGDRAMNTCDMCVNMVLHQDTTLGWTQEFRGQIAGQFQHIIQDLSDNHPGSTFSVVTFQDKPIPQLGETTDYCVSYDAQMISDPVSMLEIYANTPEGVGSDWPENQFGSLYEMVNSPTYLPLAKHSDCSTLIVTITDAAPHFEGDEWQADYPNMPKYTDDYDESKAEEFCRDRYYPTPFMVAEALLDQTIYHGSIVWRAQDLNTLALRSWSWFDSLLGQEDAFTQALFDDDQDWMTPLETIIRAFITEQCGPIATTVAPTADASTEEVITVTSDGRTQISTVHGTDVTSSWSEKSTTVPVPVTTEGAWTEPISSSQSHHSRTTTTTAECSSASTDVTTEEENGSTAGWSTGAEGSTTVGSSSDATDEPVCTSSASTSTETTTTRPTSTITWSKTTTTATRESTTPVSEVSETNTASPTAETTTKSSSTAECSCPGEDPCCIQQPELYLMIKKKPSEFDMHMKG